MPSRTRALLVALLIPLVLTCGCSVSARYSSTKSSPSSPTAAASASIASPRPTPSPGKPEQVCTTPARLADWSAIPSFVDTTMVAARLGVSDAAVRLGKFGPATCPVPIEVAKIGSLNNPVISITGVSRTCLVMGIEEDPRTVTKSRKLLVVCSSDPAAVATVSGASTASTAS